MLVVSVGLNAIGDVFEGKLVDSQAQLCWELQKRTVVLRLVGHLRGDSMGGLVLEIH